MKGRGLSACHESFQKTSLKEVFPFTQKREIPAKNQWKFHKYKSSRSVAKQNMSSDITKVEWKGEPISGNWATVK